MDTNLFELRQEYKKQKLNKADAFNNPCKQFKKWFDEASAAGVPEPNTMTLATCSADGQPSARIVLLKDFGEAGFTFFTNYESQKGMELLQNPKAALLFFWIELERQVRIEGVVEKTDEEYSDTYFASRPRASQLGAWTSKQSVKVNKRAELEEEYTKLALKYQGKEIPRPPHWGGYRLKPSKFEFWQGRESRLHDRIQYRLSTLGKWDMERLSP